MKISAEHKEWVFYDGTCNMCVGLTKKANAALKHRGFGFAPLQEDWVQEKIKHVEDPLKQMLILKSNGELIGGSEAMVYLAKQIWWARPIYWLWLVPGMKFIITKVHRFIAKNRYCISGTCRLTRMEKI